jgi:hypothetical protein
VELKACRMLTDEHVAQILGYLKSTRIEDGLLINFGSYRFQIKKYILSHERTQGTQGFGNIVSSLFFVFSAFFGGYF